VIVDCLTLWVSNLLHRGDDDGQVEALSSTVAAQAAGRPAPTVVITNEVGLGVHPSTELGRRYRDLLGRANQRWVGVASVSLLLVAGRAVRLADPWELLA
jgi:adenosyl cobinamide kinase/adenosyl cobinamide phosphate guanylyltransferase